MPTKKTSEDLECLMKLRFPGMEHYFVGVYYEPLKNSEVRKLRALGQTPIDIHKGHHFFIYCGFVDSLFAPTNVQCWRSVSIEALFRLVLAEDPNCIHHPENIPETRRRFEL